MGKGEGWEEVRDGEGLGVGRGEGWGRVRNGEGEGWGGVRWMPSIRHEVYSI